MSKTKIRRDEHGLYARGAGYIWRPDYPVGYSHAHGPTVMLEGDEVGVSHSGGPMASIKSATVRERWYSHGSYIRIIDGKVGKPIPSWELYRPDYTTWK